ncbi:hypothetical protein LTR17_005635 [Elasticomyces elasticus]|nr:hypothetical protein LTR17_005635 [Elasticomyces elasticus]
MAFTNHIDLPNYRHFENNEDWLDEVLAMELDTPSVAAASSEGAATAGSRLIACISSCVFKYRQEQTATHNSTTLLGQETSCHNNINGTTTTTPVGELYSSSTHAGVDVRFECNNGIGIARVAIDWSAAAYGVPSTFMIDSRQPRNNTSPSSTASAADNVIVCHRATDAPTGRQVARILQCGICMSPRLFDRRYELERHMATHLDGKHPCLHPGCPYTGARAFKRTEHLRNHRRRIHGIRESKAIKLGSE